MPIDPLRQAQGPSTQPRAEVSKHQDDKATRAQQYTPQQKAALGRLHQAATQLEGVFLDMLFSAMRDTVPTQDVFGKQSGAEQTFQTMLDEQRSQQMAQNGSFGIAKVLEEQLKQSVLSDAGREAKTDLPQELQP